MRKNNCFYCDGYYNNDCDKYISYSESDEICLWKRTAESDLIKYHNGINSITLKDMFNEYIKFSKEETDIIDISEIEKTIQNEKNN